MYHDQGHIPTKLIGFQYDAKTNTWGSISGVNITCGLPIIRVSVDHGTAFDKAGEGRANPESMVDAIRIAARLASPGNAPARKQIKGCHAGPRIGDGGRLDPASDSPGRFLLPAFAATSFAGRTVFAVMIAGIIIHSLFSQ